MKSAAPTLKIGNSIVRKYFLVSLLGSVLPMIVVAVLYDRHASVLLEQITGERISAQLTATASRINAFFDVRVYQIETLSNHPAVPQLALQTAPIADPELDGLLRLEADVPDLYGILLFAPDGSLTRITAGQAASGAPYWTGEHFAVGGLALTQAAGVDVVGPVPPREGSSGWFLIRQPLRNLNNGDEAGSIALHVRLASVTELLGDATYAGILQPVLKTPLGYFDVVGQSVSPTGKMVAGPEVLPGWQPMLVIDPDQLFRPFMTARQGLCFASLTAVLVIIVLFSRFARRLRQRLEPLTRGAAAISSGELDHRIASTSEDEIGRVATAFNAMASKLQALIERTVRVERLAVLGEFATGVAHEIRNPLATIKTTVQALARSEKDGERLALLEDVGAEIDRLNRVMGDLLQFGRPRPPEFEAVPARELLTRIATQLAPAAEEAGVGLNTQGDAGIVFLADRDQMIQICLNLVLNAIQATPPGGVVTLRSAPAGVGEGLIEVRDTGCGIPADILARITDPFFTTKPKGTGLGLSIARQLAELQGGRLAIASVAGQGTTVQVAIPTAREAS